MPVYGAAMLPLPVTLSPLTLIVVVVSRPLRSSVATGE